MKTLADLLGGRPGRQISNPPVDKPFDQTEGGAPPYPFPPGLIRELAGKSEDEVSSLLSKFRTGLSEHRTRLSEHRTDLSEHRTDLSGFRTELSDHRTLLSSRRTEMSLQRTAMSSDRTLMSVVRTSLSLIGFGFTIFQFFHTLNTKFVEGELPAGSPRNFGIALIVLGVVLLALGIGNHLHETRDRRQRRQMMLDQGLIDVKPSAKPSSTMVIAILLLAIGILAFARVAFRTGPF